MLTRRGFLVSAGATIIGCTSPAVLPSATVSLSSTPSPTTAPPRSASPTPGGPPDWTALAAELRGTLVRPGDTAYDAARVLYNTRFDGLRPQAIARCASAADVQACVAFARRSGIAITPRSGGHSFGGWSGGPGLVVDVGPLASIDVGGNFGIVTSFTMRTRPAVPLAIAFVTWPWSNAGGVVRAWQGWMAAMPDALWSNVHLDAASGPEPTVLVHAVAMEDAGTLQAQLDRPVSDVGSAPDGRTVLVRSYADAMLLEGGCAQLTAAQCHLTGTVPDEQLARETSAAKSAIAAVPLTEPAIGAMLGALEDLQALPNAGAGSILIDAMGGAVAQVAADATAFPHRSAIATLQFVAGWQANAPSARPTRRWPGCAASTAGCGHSSGPAHT